MERRDLLRALASAAALTVLPHKAAAAWERVASGLTARLANGLSDAHMALVKAIADTIIPRTDTPSATDVGVHDFVNVIVAEQLSEPERTQAFAGLDAIDASVRTANGSGFVELNETARGTAIAALESGPRDADPARTYWALKGLVVHGYFTSERVMKDVLKTTVMPGRFEGAAPVQIKPRQAGTPKPDMEDAHAHA